MNLQSSLIDLGLSKQEAEVYLALVDLGTTQAGPVVKVTGLHRAQVYTALERLEKLGLITVVRKKRIQSFQVGDPGVLIDQVRRLRLVAGSTVEELRSRLSHRDEAVGVRTLVGREGFLTNLKETTESASKDPQKLLCIMGGAGGEGNNPMAVTGAWYPDYVKLSQDLKIKKHLLATEEHAKLFISDFLPYPNNRLRVIRGLFSTPTFIRITWEMVTMEFYQPEPTIIQIRNKTIAKTHRDQFAVLWEQGKEIKREGK